MSEMGLLNTHSPEFGNHNAFARLMKAAKEKDAPKEATSRPDSPTADSSVGDQTHGMERRMMISTYRVSHPIIQRGFVVFCFGSSPALLGQ